MEWPLLAQSSPFAKSNFTCDFRSRRPRCAQLVLGSARTQLSSHSGTWVSPAFTLVAQVDFGSIQFEQVAGPQYWLSMAELFGS